MSNSQPSLEERLAAEGLMASYEPREEWVRCRLYRTQGDPIPALIYWGPGCKSFTCVTGAEQAARLIGYKVAVWAEWCLDDTQWLGTKEVEGIGTWVAQFEWRPEEDE